MEIRLPAVQSAPAGQPASAPASAPESAASKRLDAALEGQVRSVMIGQAKVQAVGAQPSGQTGPTSMVDRMKNEGMTNVSDPPSDDQLREYYSKHAPAHESIAAGDFSKAAEQYRELKNKESNASSFSTYDQIEQQLRIASMMKGSGVKNVQFPPSEQNAKDYFKALGQKDPPLTNAGLGKAFEQYVKAFYRHEGRDVVYRTKNKPDGKGGEYPAKAPESWSEVTGERNMYPQATRKIDCEGYAYLAKELLGQAGLKDAKFVAVGPPDDPSTKDKNESEAGHVMLAGERGGKPLVVSNDKVLTQSENREDLIDLGYPKGRGGPQVEDSVAWKASRKYEEAIY
jgi:hypothetical protein